MFWMKRHWALTNYILSSNYNESPILYKFERFSNATIISLVVKGAKKTGRFIFSFRILKHFISNLQYLEKLSISN